MLIQKSTLVCAIFLTFRAVSANIIHNTKRTEKEPSGKFIHITDLHLDPYYVEGSDVSSFCHRSDPEFPFSKKAGKFGTLGSDCDSPKSLIDAVFAFMSEQAPDVDFAIYTGDSVRHDRDMLENPRTAKQVEETQRTIVEYFQKTYQKVIPVIGNNDIDTHNSINEHDPQYERFKNIWTPAYDLGLGESFKQGGYYTYDIAPKLQAIGLNTLSFIKKNAMTSDCNVPGSQGRNQLDWLTKNLEIMRQKSSKAYIITHVPPNSKKDKHLFRDQCYVEYYAILGSFSDVILGHFSGHFSHDQLTAILMNKTDKSYTRAAALGEKNVPMTTVELEQYEAVGVMFNAPTVAPEQAPSVRVYHYAIEEGGKYPYGTILDWEQYYTDLEEANKSGNLEFKLEYKASDLYKVNHFDPTGLQQVFKLISTDNSIRDQYKRIRKVGGSKKKAPQQ